MRLALLCLFAAASAQAAGLRAANNVPLRQVPERIRKGQGPLLARGLLDVTRPPYGARPDDALDDGRAFQRAIDDAYANNLIVWIPGGTYRFSGPLTLRQRPMTKVGAGGQHKFAHVLRGEVGRKGRPVLELKDGAALPPDGVFIRYEWARGEASSPQERAENASRHYSAGFRGIDLDLGRNPSAVGLSMDGAQLCVIEDVDIRGQAFAAGIRDLPGSGGSTTHVRVFGGDVGILQTRYRPSPSLQGVTLIGQRLAGIRVELARGPLVVTGFRIVAPVQPSPAYRGIVSRGRNGFDSSAGNLVLVDGSLDVPGTAGIAIEARDADVFLSNVYVRAATALSAGAGGKSRLAGVAGAWRKLTQASFASAADHAPLVIASTGATPRDQDRLRSSAPLLDEPPPGDFVRRHVWSAADFPDLAGGDWLDITRFGARAEPGADAAPAINAALRASVSKGNPGFGKAVLIPRGHFRLCSPVVVPVGARLIGVAHNLSVLEVDPAWAPKGPAVAVDTQDAEGPVVLADFSIQGVEPPRTGPLSAQRFVTLLRGRASGLLVRDVFPTRAERWRQDLYFQAPAVELTGHAGGRVYNLALDLHVRHAEASPTYRALRVDGVTRPLFLYQPDVEGSPVGPQVELSHSRDVVLVALKAEREHAILRVGDSTNVAVLGASGNNSLYLPTEPALLEVRDSSGVLFANLSRKPDPRNPRDRPEKAAFSWVKDGERRVPADGFSLALYQHGAFRLPAP